MNENKDRDPVYTPAVYLLSCDVVRSLAEDLAIDFELHSEGWGRSQAERHFADRNALIRVQGLLLDAAERLLG